MQAGLVSNMQAGLCTGSRFLQQLLLCEIRIYSSLAEIRNSWFACDVTSGFHNFYRSSLCTGSSLSYIKSNTCVNLGLTSAMSSVIVSDSREVW